MLASDLIQHARDGGYIVQGEDLKAEAPQKIVPGYLQWSGLFAGSLHLHKANIPIRQ